MNPLVPAQVPSVETLPVGEGAAEETLVDEGLTVDETTGVLEALVEETAGVLEALVEETAGVLEALTEELLGLLLPQFPKADWQPVPQ